MEAELKANAKNAIFERDFAKAFNKYLKEKQDGSDKTRAAKNPDEWKEYQLKKCFEPAIKPLTFEGDNKFKSVKWASLLQEAAFYFDLPTL